MMKAQGEDGFSLLELIVAVGLTIGIMAVVFGLMTRNQEVFVAESGVTDMHQNVRVSMDLLTRDVQSAGMGLPLSNPGSFAAIFYTDGEEGAPDSIMIINGDPYAPTADVTEKAASSAEFICMVPPDIITTGNGSNVQISYRGKDNYLLPIYKNFDTNPQLYIVYDDKKAMVLSLTQDGLLTGPGNDQRLHLNHNPSNYMNPPNIFGTPLDQGEPNYENAKIAVLGNMIGYRLNRNTRELERTEDLVNWFSVARGVTDFQVRYRVVSRNGAGQPIEDITSAPAERREIRAVEIIISAETPDLGPGDKGYRQMTQRFEVASRNFNLLNNTNLSQIQ